jgi:hypothetical protein
MHFLAAIFRFSEFSPPFVGLDEIWFFARGGARLTTVLHPVLNLNYFSL